MISIIIPVYNVATYLNECISSVIKQTYTEWECILIDDGSTDNSGKICKEWQIKDKRIIFIQQKNCGVSKARNVGIDKAKGEYITFIDSDDWVDANYLYDLVKEATSCTDLIISGLYKNYNNNIQKEYIFKEYTNFIINRDNIDPFVKINELSLLYGPVAKLYKASIIKNFGIYFPNNIAYGEDLIFNYEYLSHINTISNLPVANYHYRIIGDGTLSSKFRENQFETDYNQWKILYKFYANNDMLDEKSEKYLYIRLWGIVYDGIFLSSYLPTISIKYIKSILSINEITHLKNKKKYFNCSFWIKSFITHRLYLPFYFYFLIKQITK